MVDAANLLTAELTCTLLVLSFTFRTSPAVALSPSGPDSCFFRFPIATQTNQFVVSKGAPTKFESLRRQAKLGVLQVAIISD
jgi:hypothetical protein